MHRVRQTSQRRPGMLQSLRQIIACGRKASRHMRTDKAGRGQLTAGSWAHLLSKHATEGVCHLCQCDVLPSHRHALVSMLLWPGGNDCRRHGADVIGGTPGQLQARQGKVGASQAGEGGAQPKRAVWLCCCWQVTRPGDLFVRLADPSRPGPPTLAWPTGRKSA